MSENDADQVIRLVGRRIAELRTGAGLTQEQMAHRAEVSLKYLQRVEAGQENLTIRSLVRLANLFAVPLADLFSPPETYEPRPRGRPPSRAD